VTGALERVVDRAAGRRGAGVERCGLCGDPVAEQHRHVIDERDALMCVCVPCTLLLDREGAGAGRYRLVPDRRTRLADVSAAPLGVPVGLAFFVRQGDGRVLAHYPSPLGTTQAEVDAAAWSGVEAGSAALAGMSPRVEALLVWTRAAGERTDRFIVPVDECYRLVGVVRRNWRGMSGGTALWREVARFFEDLSRRSDGHVGSRR
jgi:hypothetical protein